MYKLKTNASFDSAHFLAGYQGKCANIHGHHRVVEVTISGDELQETGTQRGMLIDFGDMKKAVRALTDIYDHALIYESGSLRIKTVDALLEEGFRLIEIPYRPTAENFARMFFQKLKEQGLHAESVTVYETPDNCAVYEEK